MDYPLIVLGAWAWGHGAAGGDQVFGSKLKAEELEEVFMRAEELGLKLWDTAAVYGEGTSEEILGSFMESKSDVIISTKFTPQIASSSADAMREMLDGSLRRLHRDSIDLYWIHNPMDVEKWTPDLIPLLREGLVKSVGVSNHNLSELKRAEEILSEAGFHISAVQNHYSLLHRSSERAGILDYCKNEGIAFFSYMVLEQGALSGKYDTDHPFPSGSARDLSYGKELDKITLLVRKLEEVGKAHGLSAAQCAIAWALAKGTHPIIGVTKRAQVDEAYEVLGVELGKSEIAELEETADKIEVNTLREWEKEM